MGKAVEDPQRSKRNLLEDSDSESEDGGAAVTAPEFSVNEEFARRFEHNKKREERQRLEEKFKKTGKSGNGQDDDDDEDSSSDEDEDEDGFLATEDLDAQISATLQAIRNKDPKVYDKKVTFYSSTDEPTKPTDGQPKEKPVYLKDYHREKLLRGDTGASYEDEDTPMSYNQEQEALKKSIVSEFHAAVDDESDDEDGGFMKKKESAKVDSNGVHPERNAKVSVKITEADVVNADKDPENFLSNFLAARAWVPPDGSNWEAFESDEGEDDDQADQFEQAYNLRFEDPEKSNEFLRSYARDFAAAKSVRREEKNSRKRARELEKERKEEEQKQRREEKARLRKLKLEEAEEKLRKIKHAAGSAGKDLTDEEWMKFLDDAWENDKWEAEMQKRFGEEYYADKDDVPLSEDEDENEDGTKKKKKKNPKKPKWDDDIDIKDIIPDFEDEEKKPEFGLSDLDEDAAEDEDQEDEDDRPSKKRKTTDHKRERKEAQKQARQERAKLEALVDSKMELSNPDILAKPVHAPFRYRETSPQSFGMTARDILLAPSDKDLNEFAGLKKLATYRDPEKKRRDRKYLGKKARLRQWRRDIFGTEFERTGPTYGFERIISAEDEAAGGTVIKSKKKDEDDNVVGEVGGDRKKKRKRSKGKKKAAVVGAEDEDEE